MNNTLLLVGTVMVICVLAYRMTRKLSVPSLLIFILLGMAFGENGIFRITFNDYAVADVICSISLIFIMYYGGFGTNLKAARSVAVKSILLSTLGVVMTAGITGALAHYALRLSWAESLLYGSVIASTDAASVFNILRTKQLNLKENTASLLELESGSNDPMSYMLTVVLVTLMAGSSLSMPILLFKQIVFGLAAGAVVGCLAVWLLRKVDFAITQGHTIFVFAIAIVAYALPAIVGGNGYLSVYICGILMGNTYIPQKRDLVQFFDTITGIAQMMIFFLLGLLVTPVELGQVFIPALVIMVILTVIARPLSVAAILLPFRSSLGQIGIVSWAGLRGVASIVFSIYAVLNHVELTYDIFNLVFCIVLLSMALQGGLLAEMSVKMNMIDENSDVRKTFNDYQEESDINFSKLHMNENHPWSYHSLKQIPLPPEMLIVLVIRNKNNYIVPNGDTMLMPGDLLVLAAKEFENKANLMLQETIVEGKHKYTGKKLKECPQQENTLIVLVKREGKNILPDGDTTLYEGDVLVLARFD